MINTFYMYFENNEVIRTLIFAPLTIHIKLYKNVDISFKLQ